GTAAFAHKAGLHTSALIRRSDAYEHIRPDLVGNGTRVVVSELAGRSTLQMKAAQLGLLLDSPALQRVLQTLKRLEHAGYHFEAADGSLELLMRSAAGESDGLQPFRIESYRVITDWRANQVTGEGDAPTSLVHPWSSEGELTTEATVKIHVGDKRIVSTAEG
ncbi:alpha-isopropylmalate/homocitrate synthase family transferase, partial [mine drainage metagenome]